MYENLTHRRSNPISDISCYETLVKLQLSVCVLNGKMFIFDSKQGDIFLIPVPRFLH